MWKSHNAKIEIVCFVIKSGRKLIIGVKFEVNFKKMKLFLLFPLSQDLRGYINRIQEAKLGLLIDRTSSILKVRLKALTSVLFCCL